MYSITPVSRPLNGLSPSDLNRGLTLIGDLHGCSRLLKTLLLYSMGTVRKAILNDVAAV